MRAPLRQPTRTAAISRNCFKQHTGPSLVGQKFALLTVLRWAPNEGWECRCDCGKLTFANGWSMHHGHRKSCGCLPGPLRHGMRKTPTYKSYDSMKYRCNNPHFKDYDRYGGRGIKVCASWLESFANFLRDMGPRPDGMTLDRIDNSKGYSPDNCRWASAQAQAQNRRTTVYACAFGETKKLQDWASDSRCVVHYRLLRSRLRTRSWDAEVAMTTPRDCSRMPIALRPSAAIA